MYYINEEPKNPNFIVNNSEKNKKIIYKLDIWRNDKFIIVWVNRIESLNKNSGETYNYERVLFNNKTKSNYDFTDNFN